MEGPNPLKVAWSILRSRRLRKPVPAGNGTIDHSALAPALEGVARGGAAALATEEASLAGYMASLAGVDPDTLGRDEALAYWLNLYNAGTLDLARRTLDNGIGSVLRVPGAFDRPVVTIAGEALSLEGIEHGKIRRFGDPRIHAALVCGSASCPTLRSEPFTGDSLNGQLDDQTRYFLANGGAILDGDTLRLSRVFLWYGADWVRPRRMPTFLPAGKQRVARALIPWLDATTTEALRSERPRVVFQDYSWALGCAVNRA